MFNASSIVKVAKLERFYGLNLSLEHGERRNYIDLWWEKLFGRTPL
jgi:hypothetical protein